MQVQVLSDDVTTHPLIRYDAARAALAECHRIDDAKDIADKALALQAYARQARDPDMERWVAEIRLRARRRVGELSAALEVALNQYDARSSGGTSKSDALETAGLTRTEAFRCEQIAKVPEEVFESYIAAETAAGRTVTADEVVRRVAKSEKDSENAKLKAASPPPPKGRYECIVIDPPWDMQKIERDVRPNQVAFDYPTMSEDELIEFGVPELASADAHLFCWATQKHLPVALRLVEEWGFRYVLTMVWHKAGGFQPIGLPQYNCEFIVYARQGSPKFIDTKAFNCCFTAARREHSRKPDEFYDVIRRVTSEPRIDVFSRETREGFTSFGNEIQKFAA